ncbi:hypothetical protein [Streptomyces pratensis]|uniref:hypothetical protein n=1 Tax=Streptomyces pratensis TaxID=1169025 RepID=UPI00363E1A50
MGGSSDTERTGREPGADEDTGAEQAGAESPGEEPAGGIAVGEFDGGALAAGPRAEAEDAGRRIGRPRGGNVSPPPVLPPVPGGISIGRMTGGAAASGPDAKATDRSERFIEATPQLVDALRLLRGESGELRAEAAEAEREIETTGGVQPGRLRRLASLAGLAAGSVGGQTAAGVASGVITGMLS